METILMNEESKKYRNIEKHETLTAIPPIHVYIDRINNRFVFKIKNGYMLEFQTPETIVLFGSTKKLVEKQKTEKLC